MPWCWAPWARPLARPLPLLRPCRLPLSPPPVTTPLSPPPLQPVAVVAGRVVPARYTLRQAADYEAVRRQELLEDKIHRGEVRGREGEGGARRRWGGVGGGGE